MKVCFKCNKMLPASEFYRHKQMADGRLGKCITCTIRDVHQHRLANLDKIREYDRNRAMTPKRRRLSVEKNRSKKKSHPHYYKARQEVAKAIKNGILIRPQRCERCSKTGRIHGHHDDHYMTLDVMWLCPVCHAARHKELGRLRTIKKGVGAP